MRGGGAGQGLGFSLEALEGQLARGEVDAEDLDGHRAAQACVPAAIEEAHPASRKGGLDFVRPREDGPDEGVGGDRARRRAVTRTEAFTRAGAADGAASIHLARVSGEGWWVTKLADAESAVITAIIS